MSGSEQRSTPAAFGRAVHLRAANLDAWLHTVGMVLLVAGLQASVFGLQITDATDSVPQSLVELEHERGENGKMNEALRALQVYQRASRDGDAKRQVLELRDTVVERYAEDRRGAVEALRAAADSLVAHTSAEEDALAELRRKVEALVEIYADRTGAALERYTSPRWYLQPTASLLNDDAGQLHALRFNHALYLMHSGDPAAAVTLLESMRGDDHRHNAEVDFALARLAFEAWVAEPDPVLFAESLERATRGVREAADKPLPKLFLEYLLSLERSAEKVDLEPEEGQGDGEGRGERGVKSTDRREF